MREQKKKCVNLAVFFAGARPTRLSHRAKVVPPGWDEVAKILLSPFSKGAAPEGRSGNGVEFCAGEPSGAGACFVYPFFDAFCLVFFGFRFVFRFASLLDGWMSPRGHFSGRRPEKWPRGAPKIDFFGFWRVWGGFFESVSIKISPNQTLLCSKSLFQRRLRQRAVPGTGSNFAPGSL